MPIDKILIIGNNTNETNTFGFKKSKTLNLPYHGLLDNVLVAIEKGVYFTSIEDIHVSGVIDIVEKFDSVEILEQHNSIDRSSYEMRLALKKSLQQKSDTRKEIKDKLFFIGCSHTSGVGHQNHTTVYPYILSNKLGKERIVRGFPGRGNFKIEQTLNEVVLTNSEVIIQFADLARIDFYDNKIKNPVAKTGKEFSKDEMFFYTEEYLFYEFTKLIDRVVYRLRDANAKFLFFYMSGQHPTYFEVFKYMANYSEFCFIPDYDVDYAPDGHFGIKSHKLIARRLYKKWNELYAP